MIGSLFDLPDVLTPGAQQEPQLSGEKFFVEPIVLSDSGTKPRGAGATDDEGNPLPEGEALSSRRANARRPDGRGAPPGVDSCGASGKLDLNAATIVELEALPGIGPALAARIVKQREESGEFRSVDELLAVRGIGEKTLSKFREWVCVSRRR